jgi:putative endonuclease
VKGFTYLYILRSIVPPDHYYVGLTANLSERLNQHNRGAVPHTGKCSLWEIKTALSFRDPRQALTFERYLKSASRRAFAKKRL